MRADTDSSFREFQKGHLQTTEGIGSIHSKRGSSRACKRGTSKAIVTTVYMTEACLNTYKSAKSDEAYEWQDAIHSEDASLKKNKVLKFIHKVPGTKEAIPTKLILQGKLNLVGQKVRYKRGLMAQGLHQVEGLDFIDTFAPVVSLLSVRIVVSIAAAKGSAVRQMDVGTAFLCSKLQEEVFVSLQVDVCGGERLACLNSSLNGLKQSPQCGYTTINNFPITKKEFCRARFDCCVYT